MLKTAPSQSNLILPIEVTLRSDINRLIRELTAVEEFLTQAAVRKPGTAVTIPRLSRSLERLATDNKINLLTRDDRDRLREFLMEVKKSGPMMHISFSSDPSSAFLQRITSWFRQEVHPWTLLEVGLQPNIGAGCVLRTPNKVFDFSLHNKLQESRPLLAKQLTVGKPA